MKQNLSAEEKEQLKVIIESLGESLDITETQYNNLVTSYNAVGSFLESDPMLAPYKPKITPQGSLRLGTIIQPINEDDDLDVDLVYRLTGKEPHWTQAVIKNIVGTKLRSSDRYSSMLDKEGRRCWTLLYRDKTDNPKEKYHMDILPSVTDSDYTGRVQRMFNESYSQDNVDRVAIRTTDKRRENYDWDPKTENWLKSNPDGFAFWFATRCKMNNIKERFLVESVVPIDKYNNRKYPLQRIVQILKRHRDWMFVNDKDDKPISIIITTLAARAYKGEDNILEGLLNVINTMESFIQVKNGVYNITNPVDAMENFADKWAENPKKKENFYKWLTKINEDIQSIIY